MKTNVNTTVLQVLLNTAILCGNWELVRNILHCSALAVNRRDSIEIADQITDELQRLKVESYDLETMWKALEEEDETFAEHDDTNEIHHGFALNVVPSGNTFAVWTCAVDSLIDPASVMAGGFPDVAAAAAWIRTNTSAEHYRVSYGPALSLGDVVKL